MILSKSPHTFPFGFLWYSELSPCLSEFLSGSYERAASIGDLHEQNKNKTKQNKKATNKGKPDFLDADPLLVIRTSNLHYTKTTSGNGEELDLELKYCRP